MADPNIIASIYIALALYCFAAGVGEFRKPGFWAAMMDDIDSNPALRFLTGIVCIAIGTPLFLIVPWNPQDYLSLFIKIMGAWIVIEGALFIAIGDLFMQYARKIMLAAPRLWAKISMLIGAALMALGINNL